MEEIGDFEPLDARFELVTTGNSETSTAPSNVRKSVPRLGRKSNVKKYAEKRATAVVNEIIEHESEEFPELETTGKEGESTEPNRSAKSFR